MMRRTNKSIIITLKIFLKSYLLITVENACDSYLKNYTGPKP